MIFYHIQAHGDFDYLKRLIGYIYHPENFYSISIDSSVSAEKCGELEPLRGYRNIILPQKVAITWCGFSIANSLLLGIKRFLESPPHLTHFINLSGVDLPLKSQEEIFAVLAEADGAGPTAWVSSFRCDPEYFIENAIPANSYRTFRIRPNVEFMVESSLVRLVEGPRRELFLRPELRAAVMAQEIVGEKLIVVRPLLDAEHRARVALFGDHGCRMGRGYYIFNRKFCEIALGFEKLHNACQVLAGTIGPSELLFQTLLPLLPGEIVHHNANYRFRAGAPEVLTDAMLPELTDTDAFFARKLDFPNCAALLQWADQRCAASRERFLAGNPTAGAPRAAPPDPDQCAAAPAPLAGKGGEAPANAAANTTELGATMIQADQRREMQQTISLSYFGDFELRFGSTVIQPEGRSRIAMGYWQSHPRIAFFLNTPPNGVLLDMGCSRGGLANARTVFEPKRPDIRMLGWDLDTGPFHHLYEKVCLGDFNTMEIPFGADSVDAVIASHFLEHLKNHQKFCSDMFKVMKPGAQMFIEIPAAHTKYLPHSSVLKEQGLPAVPSNFFEDGTHVDTYAPHELQKFCERAGFKTIACGYVSSPGYEDQLLSYGFQHDDQELATYGFHSKVLWACYVVVRKPNEFDLVHPRLTA